MFSPTITLIIFAVIALTGFGGGFAVADWRNSGQLEQLRGENTVLKNSNNHCAADIKSAKAAMTDLFAQVAERERQAADAMTKAQPKVEQRQAVITKIKTAPAVPIDQQCQAIKAEQLAYVAERRAE